MEKLASGLGSVGRVLEAALRALLRYPLCDRCLGRLFARLGRGLDNAERGRAIKTLLAMFLDELRLSDEELRTLAANGGLPPGSVPELGAGAPAACYVCGSRLGEVVSELGERAAGLLREMRGEVGSFLVGVEAGSEYERREQEVIGSLGLDTWESVRREVKRLVGKRIAEELSITPRFSNPEVIALVDLERREVRLRILPVLLRGRYVKVGRYISQMPWIRRDGARKYKLSVYEACQNILKLFGGRKLVIHAAGREDADARMLGDGRPLVVEVKDPSRLRLPVPSLRCESPGPVPWVTAVVEGRATREYVRTMKTRPSRKTYRVVVVVPEGITEKDVERILGLSGTVVYQRTPTRVLGRKKDAVRRRRVYELKVNPISRHLLEVLVKTDGGLYVKELVEGDGGRTTPSFSEVTGKSMSVVMLDVVRVESPV